MGQKSRSFEQLSIAPTKETSLLAELQSMRAMQELNSDPKLLHSFNVKMTFTPTPRQRVQSFRSTALRQWPTIHCGHKSTSSKSC